jgi:hypothetical protein
VRRDELVGELSSRTNGVFWRDSHGQAGCAASRLSR